MEKTSAKIEKQITALEFALVRATTSGKPQKQLFALNGKIKKLKMELEGAKQFEFLAR